MKKLLTKKDLIIIITILILCGVLFAIKGTSSAGNSFVVTVNGKSVFEESLNGEYLEKNFNGVTICRENGAVFIKSSSCKDKICVRTGKIQKKGESAVCVPNGVVVTIKGTSNNHAITG